MKTVQEWLKKLKTKKLIKTFFHRYPIEYNKKYFKNLTIKEIDKLCIKKVKKYIKRLRKLKIKNTNLRDIIYAYKSPYNEFDVLGIRAELINLDEFIQDGYEVKSYAYEHIKQNRILGFLVANTEFNKKQIYELMAEIMYEASFFGFKQEKLKKHLKALKKASKEYKKGKTYKFKSKYIQKDPQEDKMKDVIERANSMLYDYYRQKELENIKTNLNIYFSYDSDK